MKIKRMFERYRASFNERIQRFDRRLTWGQGFNRLKTANESIWFFGCSHVVGTGVDYDKVCSHVLEQLSGIKVLNFGLCAGGPMAVRDELYKLLAKGYTPKGIIIAWPSSTRWQHKTALGERIFWHPALLDDNKKHNDHCGSKYLYKDAYQEYQQLALSGKIIEVNRQVVNEVRDRVKCFNYIEFTFNQVEDLDIKMLTPELDKARDNSHPGPLTHIRVAEILNEEIKIWN
jgi:hypothetical protein